MTKLFKDFCGVLNEESMRRNFVLIYEILDEVLDGGYPQHTSTEKLKGCIHNEAFVVESLPAFRPLYGVGGLINFGLGSNLPIGGGGGTVGGTLSKTVPSHASHRPVGTLQQQQSASLGGSRGLDAATQGVLALARGTLGRQALTLSGVGGSLAAAQSRSSLKSEIFVDILERLTVVMNAQGSVLNSQVDGCIQMKSYLIGKHALRLALNEDLIIKENGEASSYGSSSPRIDDCNFSEHVDTSAFEKSRLLTIRPTDGEFTIMHYRITDEFQVPFRIVSNLQQTSETKLELLMEIHANMPPQHYGGNVTVTCPMPRSVRSVTTETMQTIPQSSVDFLQQESKVVWTIKKFQGGTTLALRIRISLQSAIDDVATPFGLNRLKKEMGPISMAFEIPMYNVSNLQIRYLRIVGNTFETASPFRWVRYVTQSSSYVGRL